MSERKVMKIIKDLAGAEAVYQMGDSRTWFVDGADDTSYKIVKCKSAASFDVYERAEDKSAWLYVRRYM